MPERQLVARRRRMAPPAAARPHRQVAGLRRVRALLHGDRRPALLERHPPALGLSRVVSRRSRSPSSARRSKGSEMITELYVPAPASAGLHARGPRRRAGSTASTSSTAPSGSSSADDETVLAWARERWACIVFNLHVEHTADGHRESRGRLPPPDRSRHPVRRQLLPDLSPLGDAPQLLACHPRHPRVPRRKSASSIRAACSAATGSPITNAFSGAHHEDRSSSSVSRRSCSAGITARRRSRGRGSRPRADRATSSC